MADLYTFPLEYVSEGQVFSSRDELVTDLIAGWTDLTAHSLERTSPVTIISGSGASGVAQYSFRFSGQGVEYYCREYVATDRYTIAGSSVLVGSHVQEKTRDC